LENSVIFALQNVIVSLCFGDRRSATTAAANNPPTTRPDDEQSRWRFAARGMNRFARSAGGRTDRSDSELYSTNQ
jgi:hypothetical protein